MDDNDYEWGTQKLKVDLTNMLTKARFTENIEVWFRQKYGQITVQRKGGYANPILIPLDENIIFYSGGSTVDNGAVYQGDLDGILTLGGTNAS